MALAMRCCMSRVALSFALLASCEASFGDRLFQGALAYANQSLYGRFIRQMVNGTLPQAAFEYYLQQDNLYLSKYARAFGVMAAKSSRTDELAWLLNKSAGFLHEHGRHANGNLSELDFQQQASAITVAYTSFLMESAWGEDMVVAYASVLPCQRLYDWVFATVNKTEHIAEDNPYKKFIEQYAAPSNHALTQKMESFLERYAGALTQDELERAQAHYDQAMKYEAQFFDQALRCDGSRGDCNSPALVTVRALREVHVDQSAWPVQALLGAAVVGFWLWRCGSVAAKARSESLLEAERLP